MNDKTCGHCTHSTPLEDAGWPKQGDLLECAVNGFVDDDGAVVSPDWVMPSHSCAKFKSAQQTEG